MEYYVSQCASHHAIKGRLNIAVRGFIRSKFNLHSAFKQERAQPCVGKLSGMLRDLIYGSLSTRSRFHTVSRNFRLVTRHFRLCRGRLHRSYQTSSRSLFFYGESCPAWIMVYMVYIVDAKISYDARDFLRNFLFVSASPLCFSNSGPTKYKGQRYLYVAI